MVNQENESARVSNRFRGRRHILQAGMFGCLGLDSSGLLRAATRHSPTLLSKGRIRSCIFLYYSIKCLYSFVIVLSYSISYIPSSSSARILLSTIALSSSS